MAGAMMIPLWLRFFVFFCFFISGLCALIYEIVWTRMLILVFGSTSFAVSTVLAAFMGGMALGSYLFGKYAEKVRNLLSLYGLLEIGIGIYSILIPWILILLHPIYKFVWDISHLSYYSFSLMRFLLVFAVLVLPTTFMGATLPVISKFFVRKFQNLGVSVGSLYGVNTFGAVAGTFLSGFIMLPYLGQSATIFLAATGNILIGSIAISANYLSARLKKAGERVSELFETQHEPPKQEETILNFTKVQVTMTLIGF
jgi:spermidine synthase